MHPLEFTGTKVPIKVNDEMKGLYRTIQLDAERHLPKIAFWFGHSAK